MESKIRSCIFLIRLNFFYDALEKHFEMDKKTQKGKWYTKSIKDIVKNRWDLWLLFCMLLCLLGFIIFLNIQLEEIHKNPCIKCLEHKGFVPYCNPIDREFTEREVEEWRSLNYESNS